MTTVMLVGLIVVLLAAAAYVGVLLVRRSRSAPAEAEPGSGPAAERPRTVADLLRRRAAPVDDPAAELSGEELFVPQVPRQDGVAVPAVPDAPRPSRRPLQRRPGSRPPRWMVSRSATPPGAAPRG